MHFEKHSFVSFQESLTGRVSVYVKGYMVTRGQSQKYCHEGAGRNTESGKINSDGTLGLENVT